MIASTVSNLDNTDHEHTTYVKVYYHFDSIVPSFSGRIIAFLLKTQGWLYGFNFLKITPFTDTENYGPVERKFSAYLLHW